MTLYRAAYLILGGIGATVAALTESGDITGPIAIVLPIGIQTGIAILAEMGANIMARVGVRQRAMSHPIPAVTIDEIVKPIR